MLKVGLTGGIGSGKTTVANLFRLKGVPVIDADGIAREVVIPGSRALFQIEQTFGSEFIQPNGELNRSKLRECVFKDKIRLKQLNAIVHPLVRLSISEQISKIKSPYVILDIPLLFENNMESWVDRILVIDVSEDCQIERVMNRDTVSKQNVLDIMNKQVSRNHRLQYANDVIDNSQTLNQLRLAVEKLHQKFLVLSENN